MSPGRSSQGLPASARENLPSHAQEIYKKAHDSALEQYKDPEERRGSSSREETAHKVAWAAVKKEYRKNSKGDWVEKNK